MMFPASILKFALFPSAVTLKIYPMPPKPNQVFIMPQSYIHENLAQIHPLVHEISCIEDSVTARGSAPKTMSRPLIKVKKSIQDQPASKELKYTWIFHVFHDPVHCSFCPGILGMEYSLLTALQRKSHIHELTNYTFVQLKF